MRRIDLRTAVIVLILANFPTWIVIFFNGRPGQDGHRSGSSGQLQGYFRKQRSPP